MCKIFELGRSLKSSSLCIDISSILLVRVYDLRVRAKSQAFFVYLVFCWYVCTIFELERSLKSSLCIWYFAGTCVRSSSEVSIFSVCFVFY